MQLKTNYWIENRGQVVLSRWRAALLRAVEDTGSITAAAQRMNVPYKRAWEKIHECEDSLGVKLVETQTGGIGGGGARLTKYGADFVQRFQDFCSQMDDAAKKHSVEVFGDLKELAIQSAKNDSCPEGAESA